MQMHVTKPLIFDSMFGMTQDYKTQLEQRLRELEAQSAKGADARDAVELDQTRMGRLSRQDALIQQEMAKATQRNRELEIQRVKSALARIESDDFGYCLSCDEEIDEKRLNHDPAVPTCLECAST